MHARRGLALGSAATLITAAVIIAALEGTEMTQEGGRAPDFSAHLSTGETIRLADFYGNNNVVLSFYPGDFTAGCTKQLCSYRDNIARLRELGAVILGVSYDSEDSHARFADAYQLPFPLISDKDRSLSKLYGAARLGGLVPLVKRVTFVIDRKGVIRHVAHHELSVGRHVEDIIRTLEEIEGKGGKGRESEPLR